MRSNCLGVMSNSTARDAGRSATDLTVRLVSISPPIDLSTPASASAIFCDPPYATGQPTACASRAKMSPNDAVNGDSSGRMAWAASPAKSARARSPLNQLSARLRADRTPFHPNRANSNGCRGG